MPSSTITPASKGALRTAPADTTFGPPLVAVGPGFSPITKLARLVQVERANLAQPIPTTRIANQFRTSKLANAAVNPRVPTEAVTSVRHITIDEMKNYPNLKTAGNPLVQPQLSKLVTILSPAIAQQLGIPQSPNPPSDAAQDPAA